MRVHVYKDAKGNLSAMVEPAPGKGKIPVVVQGITAENVVEVIAPILEEMRRPKAPRSSRAAAG